MFTWLRAGEALTSLSSIPSETMSVARSQTRGSHVTSTLASNWSEGYSEQGPADETFARGSSKSPCRAVRLVNFPRDGHACTCATGSDAFPPKSTGDTLFIRACYINSMRVKGEDLILDRGFNPCVCQNLVVDLLSCWY